MRETARTISDNTDCVLLETIRRDGDNRQSLLFLNPTEVLSCSDPAELPRFFSSLESSLDRGRYLAGFVSYECGYFLEDRLSTLPHTAGFPLAWFGVYEEPLKMEGPAGWPKDNDFCFSAPRLLMPFEDYSRALGRIRDYITAGDTYQINFTTKYAFDLFGDPTGLYSGLRRRQRVPYAGIVRFGRDWLLSFSPELFFRQDGQTIATKPMKGTAPRSAPRDWLSRDEKNRSENLMIVDLLRNDLGRICVPGSVSVPRLFTVEQYETLWQMTSTVTGKLRAGIGIGDLFRSIFPSGSVTGAPKIRSMEIIRELETEPRHVYTGAIGFIGPDRKSVFNVAIRTLLLRRKDGPFPVYGAEMGVGGGITHGSDTAQEYDECILKGRFLLEARPDFSLIETMLCEDGELPHLGLHLARLGRSADFFGIRLRPEEIRAALADAVQMLAGRHRVRLLLRDEGLKIESVPFPETAADKAKPLLVTISRRRTDSSNIFLYHKTTNRRLYSGEYEKYAAAGFADVLFRNERGEVTEGAISNIFIKRDDKYFTPPLECGLLDGIGRRLFMQQREVIEKPLFLKDLRSADEIILTNAVRGSRPVEL